MNEPLAVAVEKRGKRGGAKPPRKGVLLQVKYKGRRGVVRLHGHGFLRSVKFAENIAMGDENKPKVWKGNRVLVQEQAHGKWLITQVINSTECLYPPPTVDPDTEDFTVPEIDSFVTDSFSDTVTPDVTFEPPVFDIGELSLPTQLAERRLYALPYDRTPPAADGHVLTWDAGLGKIVWRPKLGGTGGGPVAGLQVPTCSDTPEFLKRYYLGELALINGYTVTQYCGRAYVLENTGVEWDDYVLHVMDIRDLNNVTEISSQTLNWGPTNADYFFPNGLIVFEGRTLLVEGFRYAGGIYFIGAKFFSLSDPDNPVEGTPWEDTSYISGWAWQAPFEWNHGLYMLNDTSTGPSDEHTIFNMSDPTAPVAVASFTTDAMGWFYYRHYYYGADLHFGPDSTDLVLVDVSDPTVPSVSPSSDFMEDFFGPSQIHDGILWGVQTDLMVTYANLVAVDCYSDPSSPSIISTTPVSSFIEGSPPIIEAACCKTLYVSIMDYDNQMYTLYPYDISDPTAPVVGDPISLPWPLF